MAVTQEHPVGGAARRPHREDPHPGGHRRRHDPERARREPGHDRPLRHPGALPAGGSPTLASVVGSRSGGRFPGPHLNPPTHPPLTSLALRVRKAFLDKLAADGKTPQENLIGRFGVGFYSAFMVADRIDVLTSAGPGGGGAHRWSSTGDGQYTIRAAQQGEAPEQGTRMVLHLKEDAKYFSYRAEARRCAALLWCPCSLRAGV